jgi:hypothetical protein
MCFKSISVETGYFCAVFVYSGQLWKAYMTSLTPSTTTPGPGTPPANSRCTKQYIYIYIYIIIKYYILYIIYYIIYIIYIYHNFRLQPWHGVEPPSLLLVA